MEPNNKNGQFTFYAEAEESELMEELRKVQPHAHIMGVQTVLVAWGLHATAQKAAESLAKAGVVMLAERDIKPQFDFNDLNNTRRYLPICGPEVTEGLYDVKYNKVTLPYFGLNFRYKESPPFSSKHQVCRKAKKRSKNKKTHLKKKR